MCLSFDLRFVWSRSLAMKHLYEYNESFLRAIKSRNNWFFRLDVLETIYAEKIRIEECQNRIWSIYSSWFDSCTQNNFTKWNISNQLLNTSATVFVRELYSYEIDVIDLNWLLLNVAISWLEIWNEIARIQYTHYFSNWFCIRNRYDSHSYHEFYCLIVWNCLRRRLMRMFAKFVAKNSSQKVHRRKLVVAMFFVHCLLFIETFDMRCEFDRKWSIDLIVVFFMINFCKIVFIETIRKFDNCIKCNLCLLRSYDLTINDTVVFWLIFY